MSIFAAPRFYNHHQQPNLSGLFRLIDDFETYSQGTPGRQTRRQVQTFTPKFDLRETETTYELHGELPGIQKENVHVDFSDPQTIVIRGKVQRSYTAGTPLDDLLTTKSEEMSGALPEAGDEGVLVDHVSETASINSHHATVEDAPEDETEPESAQPTPATTVAETVKPTEQPKPAPAPPKQKHKYWISERSVGEFTRSFQFPTRVEPDAATAALNNGVLTISVPKAKKHESRRITIV